MRWVVLTAWLVACTGGNEQTTVVVPTQPVPTSPPSASPVAPLPVQASMKFKCDAARFEVGNRSYCGYEAGESWDKAEEKCVANGGHLMSLDSRNTSDGLHLAPGSPVGGGRAAWIGLEL